MSVLAVLKKPARHFQVNIALPTCVTLEVVDRGSDPQLQVGENLNYLI